jgi:hypothetical protein
VRTVRFLVVAAVIAAASTAVVSSATAVPSAPYTAVTASADPVSGTGGAVVYTDSAVSVSAHTTAGFTFTTTAPDATTKLQVNLAPPTGSTFAQGASYPTSRSSSATDAQLDISSDFSGCSTATGTLAITELVESGGDVSAFAADYTYRCDSAATVSGHLRFQSSAGYAAVTQNPTSWDFGTQLVKSAGWGKTFVFTNRGTTAQSFTAAHVSNSIFKITANTCSGKTVAAGSTCAIRVVPHPTNTTTQVNATLHLPVTSQPEVRVPLRVLGSDSYPFVAAPGPERVTLTWNQLPSPIGLGSGEVVIYRGSSPSHLSPIRDLWAVSYVNHVTPGKTWYYAVRPKFGDGSLGDRSPIVATRPWPKYSAGTYHRLPSPVHWIAGHRVSAGHPLTLKVLGAHGVPAGHVAAVALNVTAQGSSATGAVYVYPNGSRRPVAPDIAVRAGHSRSNFALTAVGKGGRIVIATNHGSVPITVDVFGYFSAAGLAAKYGMGGAPHVYGYPVTLVDTKGWHWGALKHDWYVDAVDGYFAPDVTPHVSSMIVEVTAYGSKGRGTIAGFATNGRPNKTSVLTYEPGATTSTVAILRCGSFYSPKAGANFPSVSLLNRGAKPVQLVVTALGFVDDNTLPFGQRYTPTSPVHLLGAKVATNRTITPGHHAGYWTSGFNVKLSASSPTKATTVSLHGVGLGPAPAHGQLHAAAHVRAVSSTVARVGSQNRIGVHNSAGRLRLDVWSFGRFDYYPLPSTPYYAGVARPATDQLRSAPLHLGRLVHRLY